MVLNDGEEVRPIIFFTACQRLELKGFFIGKLGQWEIFAYIKRCCGGSKLLEKDECLQVYLRMVSVKWYMYNKKTTAFYLVQEIRLNVSKK
jgi:hypothetical protein